MTETERRPLEQGARGRRTPARLVLRATIALLAVEGYDHQQIAVTRDTSRQTVGLWRHRVVTPRLSGLRRMRPAAGGPPSPARR